MKIFRVESDGQSFFVQGGDAASYFNDGCAVFVSDVDSGAEEKAGDLESLLDAVEEDIDSRTHSMKIGG